MSEEITKPNGSTTPLPVKLRLRVTAETREKILRERVKGISYDELSIKYGVARNTMIGWVTKEKKLGTELGGLLCRVPSNPVELVVGPPVVPISPAIFDPLAKFTELHRVEDAQALRDIVIELLLENYHLRYKR